MKKCKISNDSSEINPIHSFGDDVCFDSNRKNIRILIIVTAIDEVHDWTMRLA